MSKKTTEIYTAVFKYIEQTFNLQPSSMMTDFEAALRKSINVCHTQSKLNGCWFHYTRAIKKKFLQLGLHSLIKTSAEARLIYNQILSLPLLPSEQFHEGYTSIKERAKKFDFYQQLEPFFEYYESYWITQVVRILH